MSSVETSPGLGGVDWLVIVVYLAAVIGLGVWLGRGQRNTRDYFLGGRDLPWWGVAFSILATETSALTFIGVPAMAYAGDLGFMQIVLGYAVGRVILAVMMVPYYFRNEIYSPYA
ncbi:MAG TPA: sodium:solute symporter, partial [Verrucomicrobiales bacterium]|nr:sodium:solute symporter [Verrucomicrobiales bacterium]